MKRIFSFLFKLLKLFRKLTEHVNAHIQRIFTNEISSILPPASPVKLVWKPKDRERSINGVIKKGNARAEPRHHGGYQSTLHSWVY